jgi:hypothetical protein
MNRSIGKRKKQTRGAASGLVASLVFHGVVFFIAGLFVVFTVVNSPEPEFEPPPTIERPKMNLKKPKVKVRKSSNPRPSSRIVAKVETKQMPEIQLPDLEGVGDGLLGGTGFGDGQFMDLPDISQMSLFGTEDSIGNDLVGTFYDLKRRKSGNITTIASDPGVETICPVLRELLESGWDRSVLDEYYRSDNKLYTSTIIIPEMPSSMAPMSFGESYKEGSGSWVVLYEGTLISYKDIRFRFWGMGDNFLAVGVDGEPVLAHWLDGLDSPKGEQSYFAEYVDWRADPTPLSYAYGHEGKWIDLKAYEPRRLQIAICDFAGGAAGFMLCVEVDGEVYPRNPFKGGHTYPIFQTAVQSRTQVEELERVIYPGDASVNEGPVFQDYPPRMPGNEEEAGESDEVPSVESGMRTWILADGRSIAAELLNQTADNAWIKTAEGREVKVPLEQLSEDDRLYLKLADVPKFRIDFTEKIDVVPNPPVNNAIEASIWPLQIKDYTFKARVKLMDTTRYTYPLTVEYFAIGGQVEGDDYILWQRARRTFTPSRENNYMLEFGSDKPLRRFVYSMSAKSARMRGEKYDGYLVTVTDQRGKIIAHRTSNEFLFENLDRLKNLPVTRHFDKECMRVAPPRPIDSDRSWAEPVFRRSLY